MTIGRTIASDVSLTLGLVRTTVSLKPRRAGEYDATGLKRICPVHAARNVGVKIQQVNVCPKVHEHTVEEGREPYTVPDLAKGRETAKDTVVPLTAAEIEYIRAIEGTTSKDMELNFHPAEQVTHLIPTGTSYAAFCKKDPDNFYGVLAHHLGHLKGLVCMGTLVLNGKAKNFIVTVNDFGIVLTEVCRDQDLYEVPVTDMTADERFIPTAGALIAAVVTDYDEALYHDNSGARLNELLAEKAANPDATVTPITVERPVPADNMLALLEASLLAAKGAA